MNIAVIAQAVIGTSCAGLFTTMIVKHEWFGIYYDVDLYAVWKSTDEADASDTTSSGISTETQKEGETDMTCWINQTKTDKHDCKIFSANTTITETTNYINANDFSKQVEAIDNSNQKKYYKITVTKKLFKELSNLSNQTIEIQKKGSTTADKKWTLDLVLLNESGWYTLLTTNTDNQDKYYVVEANKDGEQNSSTEIEKGAGFKCSYNKTSDIKNCEIKALTTDAEGINSISSITFKQTDASKIKEKYFYLIKVKDLYDSLFVKSSDTNAAVSWMKLTKKGEAFIWTKDSTEKLIHFQVQ